MTQFFKIWQNLVVSLQISVYDKKVNWACLGSVYLASLYIFLTLVCISHTHVLTRRLAILAYVQYSHVINKCRWAAWDCLSTLQKMQKICPHWTQIEAHSGFTSLWCTNSERMKSKCERGTRIYLFTLSSVHTSKNPCVLGLVWHQVNLS